MDCWQLLGVEPNSDAKAIKLAYSKLLKETRPDEDPDGFQKLRGAYKNALSYAKSEAEHHSDEGVNNEIIHSANSRSDNPDVESSEPKVNSVAVSEERSFTNYTYADNAESDIEWTDFISNAERLIQSPDQASGKKDWEELLTSSLLLDLRYREMASKRVFCLVADASLDDELVADKKISTSVIEYLNDEFQWDKNRTKLIATFGEERGDAIFVSLDEQQTDKTFKFVGLAGSMVACVVLVCGYFGFPLFPVVLIAAIPATVRRMYVRKWQVKRIGYNNGGSFKDVTKDKYVKVAVIYFSMCLVGVIYYGIGWSARFAVDQITQP